MITRIVEYVIQCDNWDDEKSGVYCTRRGAHAYGWATKDEAIAEAPKYGWVRCTRGRWLCKDCAEKLLPDERKTAANQGSQA